MTSSKKHKLSGILKGADKIWKELENKSISCDEAQRLLGFLYEKIMSNLYRHPLKWSKENWRFDQKPNIDNKNTSKEKKLEKIIAKFATTDKSYRWANQVPTASGLINKNADKKRSVDLVYDCGCNRYDFIELKVSRESGNAYYAAIEIICYGLLYLIHRSCQCYLNRFPKNELLKAKTIHLKVLAPENYYPSGPEFEDLIKYEISLNKAVSKFACEKKVEIYFSFEKFADIKYLPGLAESIFTDENRNPIH